MTVHNLRNPIGLTAAEMVLNAEFRHRVVDEDTLQHFTYRAQALTGRDDISVVYDTATCVVRLVPHEPGAR